MGKIKEIVSKNSYLVPKIAGGVAAVSVAVLTVALIVSSGDDETADGKLTGLKVAEVSAHSSKDIGETDETEELTTSNNDTAGTDELQSDTGDSTTDESTEATETTVIAMGGNNGGGNQSSGDTSGTTAPTAATTAPTTSQPATTQPTTAAPVVNKRGANGVILETLTVYSNIKASYTIPSSWTQLAIDKGYTEELNAYNISYKRVPTSTPQDVFGNGIKIYNEEDGTGSTKEDIIAIYGEPMYEGADEDIGAYAIYYKYLNTSENNEALSIRFNFSQEDTNNLLATITVMKFSTIFEDSYLQ